MHETDYKPAKTFSRFRFCGDYLWGDNHRSSLEHDMAAVRTDPVLRFIRELAVRDQSVHLTDRDLLLSFLTTHDEPSFATLVRRHFSLLQVLRQGNEQFAGHGDHADLPQPRPAAAKTPLIPLAQHAARLPTQPAPRQLHQHAPQPSIPRLADALLPRAVARPGSEGQRILRLLLQRVVVTVQGSSDYLDVALHWAGGFTSQHELIRPVLRYNQMADYARLVERIDELRKQDWSFANISERLNREGFRPSKGAKKFHSDVVSALVRRREKRLPGEKTKAPREHLRENEWLVIDLAAVLMIPKNTMFAWIKRGWIRVARQLPGYRGRTICWANADELDRLRRLRQTKHGWWDPPLSVDLTNPKVPPTG